MIALDASALLAFLFEEEGADEVLGHLSSSCLSTVNLCEVAGRFARDGHDPSGIVGRLGTTPIEVVPFDSDQAALAARLVPETRRLGLSLGDRACLALALSRGVPALTADRSWGELSVGVEIRSVR